MQAAPGGVAEHLVFVPAATGTPTVRPGSFVMSVIKGSVPIPQARHYLLDQRGHSVGRHASNPLINCLSSSVLLQNAETGYRNFAGRRCYSDLSDDRLLSSAGELIRSLGFGENA